MRPSLSVVAVTAAVLVVFALSSTAKAASVPTTFTNTSVSAMSEFGFGRLTSNTFDIGANFKFQIFDLGSQIGFRFLNNGPTASRIEEVYFYDGHLIKNGVLIAPTNALTNATSDVSPTNLPGFNPTVNALHLTRFYAADAGAVGTGITAGGYADLKFDLLSGITYQRVLQDLTSNLSPPASATPFYVGIHVQAIGGNGGKSDSYLVSPTPATPPNPSAVPLPPTVWAGLVLMAGTAIFRWRSRHSVA